MAIKIQGSVVITNDKTFVIASGNNSGRPDSAEEGMLYYNTELSGYERYTSSEWYFLNADPTHDGFSRYFYATPSGDWEAVDSFFDGSVALQSGYPELFEKIGLQGNTETYDANTEFLLPTISTADASITNNDNPDNIVASIKLYDKF